MLCSVRARNLLPFVTLLSVLGYACSSTQEEQPLDMPGVGDGGSDTATDGVTPDDSGGGTFDVPVGEVDPGCPSDLLCGAAATCCKSGEECVESACAPACASGVRCGTTCCGATQVCLAGACTNPGVACKDTFDCEENAFCEPTLGKCLPQPTTASGCEYRPPVDKLEPILEWSWTSSVIKPTFVQVINMPVVIDLDKDGIPEVVIVTSDNFSGAGNAHLRILDGKTGAEKLAATAGVYAAGNEVNPRGTPAAADLDGDGTIELVAPMKTGGVIAFKADGSLLWKSRRADGTTPYVGVGNSVTIALADMDHDGKVEVVYGGVVLDHTGKVVSGEGREKLGANDAGYGPVSIVADIDGDGQQEVVGGNAAYRKNGSEVWKNAALTDGYPAIADLDKDGVPELVVIAQGNVRVQDAKTGVLLATLPLPGTGRGGPPTIADFDADGVMEFASANGSAYSVFEYDGVTKVITAKWSKPTQDLSSNVTGSSVFDFEGDGAAEVVYNDECYVRVYSGKDGTELFKQPSSTGTIHEYPVLVDVDGDNNTEFIVVSNDLNHTATTCPADATPRHGVFVYGDKNDKWVRTRKVWNQHAYHITNVNGDGTLPMPEDVSWGPKGFNNYRVSAQGAGSYNAPDLRVDLEVSTATCPASITLRARVKNNGTLGVAAGVKVAFHAGTDATAPLLGEKATTKPLLPGQSEIVTWPYVPVGKGPFSFFVVVDGASGGGVIRECLEDNNSAGSGGAKCPSVQ